MNLIYLPHAKNQVRFEEKREKNVPARPAGNESGGACMQNGAGAGASCSGTAAGPDRGRHVRRLPSGAVVNRFRGPG